MKNESLIRILGSALGAFLSALVWLSPAIFPAYPSKAPPVSDLIDLAVFIGLPVGALIGFFAGATVPLVRNLPPISLVVGAAVIWIASNIFAVLAAAALEVSGLGQLMIQLLLILPLAAAYVRLLSSGGARALAGVLGGLLLVGGFVLTALGTRNMADLNIWFGVGLLAMILGIALCGVTLFRPKNDR